MYREINSRGTENDGYCYSNTYVYQNVKRMNMGFELMVNYLLILMWLSWMREKEKVREVKAR